MIQEFKKVWKTYVIGMIWVMGLLWPLLGIHPDGTLSFARTFNVWIYLFVGSFICLIIYLMNQSGNLAIVKVPISRLWAGGSKASKTVPTWFWLALLFVVALIYPQVTSRYGQDVAINVLIYVCLGLGLNVVVGLAGMLDLGYIAFYGVGAYTYALLNIHYGMPFWICLPFSAIFATIAASIVGYPTPADAWRLPGHRDLRVRGDHPDHLEQLDGSDQRTQRPYGDPQTRDFLALLCRRVLF